MSQSSQSGRVVNLVAVSQGNVYVARPGDSTWITPANMSGATPPLNYTGIVYSTVLNQKLYFFDGTNEAYFDPADMTVRPWTASAGTMPRDSLNNKPRLGCTWRGCIVSAGLILEPQNWFVSAVDDATDYDYGDINNPGTQAIAGTNSPQGIVGDVVTSLCPFTDDVLIFFCDHSIYLMSGDPRQGGQLDLVTDTIGGTWGICWARDPYGTLYFMSNHMGLYSMRVGEQPVRLSRPIEQLLQPVDTGQKNIRLAWDDRYQGLRVFLTDLDGPVADTHYFWEGRTGSWVQQEFANNDHNPLCCVTYDGNRPDDRAVVFGSWDGYVRAFNPSATTDDGTTIASEVWIGPLVTKDLDELLCHNLQAVMGTSSGSVTYEVYVGASAEAALASTAVVSGTWTAGRNLTVPVRRSGHAIYVRITSTNQWAMEQIRMRIDTQGKVRRRGP